MNTCNLEKYGIVGFIIINMVDVTIVCVLFNAKYRIVGCTYVYFELLDAVGADNVHEFIIEDRRFIKNVVGLRLTEGTIAAMLHVIEAEKTLEKVELAHKPFILVNVSFASSDLVDCNLFAAGLSGVTGIVNRHSSLKQRNIFSIYFFVVAIKRIEGKWSCWIILLNGGNGLFYYLMRRELFSKDMYLGQVNRILFEIVDSVPHGNSIFHFDCVGLEANVTYHEFIVGIVRGKMEFKRSILAGNSSKRAIFNTNAGPLYGFRVTLLNDLTLNEQILLSRRNKGDDCNCDCYKKLIHINCY